MKVMVACEEGEGQYDLIKAKELKQTSEHKGSSCGMHCHVYRILFEKMNFFTPVTNLSNYISEKLEEE